MSKQINIQEILEKYLTHSGEEIPLETQKQINTAFKEAIEAVIDECAKGAEIVPQPDYFGDRLPSVDRESILAVKKQIIY